MLHRVQFFQRIVNQANQHEPGPADDDGVRRFVERFGVLLAEAGMARTPARVFACVLAEDSGRLTAAQLAERLHVSPAAISGAVRYLTQAGMLVRGREPGTRRDHYAVHGDVWAEMYTTRIELLRRWERAMTEGIELLGTERPAGRRLEETREFFAFVRGEVPGLLARWQEHKAALERAT
jgi:DNA-binding transcriptional regulator GbsR (MarR family)